MKPISKALVVAASIMFAAGAHSAPINVVPYASLTGTQVITFDDVAGRIAGTNYDNVFVSAAPVLPSVSRARPIRQWVTLTC